MPSFSVVADVSFSGVVEYRGRVSLKGRDQANFSPTSDGDGRPKFCTVWCSPHVQL